MTPCAANQAAGIGRSGGDCSDFGARQGHPRLQFALEGQKLEGTLLEHLVLDRSKSMESCLIQNTSATAARYVRFGPFHIDQQTRQVFRNGVPMRLQGKVYQVLTLLLQRQGEVVTREELKHALWPAGTHVNYETNTNTTVNKLRQAVSEPTKRFSYIETVPRRGYRFAGTAEFSEIPFPVMKLGNSPAAEVIGPHSNQEAQKSSASRSYKLPTIVAVALVLVGMLLGAIAAIYWITHFA